MYTVFLIYLERGLYLENKLLSLSPLSVYELSVCNTVCELFQLRDNLYSCDMCMDMTDIAAMPNEASLNDHCTSFAFIYCISVRVYHVFPAIQMKHTEVTIYLTILLQERTVILYQIAPSRISSQITGYFMLLYNVYIFI